MNFITNFLFHLIIRGESVIIATVIITVLFIGCYFLIFRKLNSPQEKFNVELYKETFGTL